MKITRRILIIGLVTAAALVALGFWLPSFNKWTVKDIPLLVRITGTGEYNSETEFAERKLKELMKTDDGFETVLLMTANDKYLAKEGASSALLNYGPPVILESEDPTRFLDILVEHTSHENIEVRLEAYFGLTSTLSHAVKAYDDYRFMDYALEIPNGLLDEDDGVKSYVLSMIYYYGGFDGLILPVVTDIFQDSTGKTHSYAACALASLDPSNLDPVPVIIDNLDSDDEILVLFSAGNLATYGLDAEIALPALVGVMNRGELHHARQASQAIREIGPGDGSVIPLLIDLLDHPERHVRLNIIEIFRDFGSGAETALPALKERYESGDETEGDLQGKLGMAITKIETAVIEDSVTEGGDPGE